MRVQRSTVTSCGAWALRLYCCNVVGARPPDLLAIFGRQSLYVYRLKFLSSASGARALGWCPYPRISTRALRFQNRTGSVDGPWNSGPNKEVASGRNLPYNPTRLWDNYDHTV